jgi:hypothetical protein
MPELISLLAEAFADDDPKGNHGQGEREFYRHKAAVAIEALKAADYRVVRQEQVGWGIGPESDPWLRHLNEGNRHAGEWPVWRDLP